MSRYEMLVNAWFVDATTDKGMTKEAALVEMFSRILSHLVSEDALEHSDVLDIVRIED